jgi:hypothetical protein
LRGGNGIVRQPECGRKIISAASRQDTNHDVASIHTIHKGLEGSIPAQRQEHVVVLVNGSTGGRFQFSGRAGFNEFDRQIEGLKQSPQGKQMGVRSAAARCAIHKYKNGDVA